MGALEDALTRLSKDEHVKALAEKGSVELFLCQRASLVRTLFLYWPWAERLALLRDGDLHVGRLDLALVSVKRWEEVVRLDGCSLRLYRHRRRADLRQGRRLVLVFRGPEAARFARSFGRLVQ